MSARQDSWKAQGRIGWLRPPLSLAPLALAFVLILAGADGLAAPAEADERARGLHQIEHVIVLMQENRSFDHYFGELHFQGQPAAEPRPADASNPDPTNPTGPPIEAFHQSRYCDVADLDHSWTGSHLAWNGGAMDGFTTLNQHPDDPSGSRAMGYYTRDDLPFYYALYSTFATGDRYFSSVMGPTFPNRYYLLAGTSFGHIRNDLPFAEPGGFDPPNGTVFERLDEAGVSWKVYYDQVPFAAIFGYVRQNFWGHLAPLEQFYLDAALGRLPQVAYIDPVLLGGPNSENDEHPPHNIQSGQRFVAGIIEALFRSPNWRSSALFLTYDEHGGYYDHVPPPPAPRPDDIAPMLQPGDFQADFDRYGFRVPVVVVSPFARPHFVSHVVNDHTSILKFIETRFDLPPLTHRDAQANAMLEFFDFSSPAFQRPPRLPEARVNLVQALSCLFGR